TGMAFIGLSVVGDIWWWVTILVLVREWSVTLLRLSVTKSVVIAAKQSGKVKTALQGVALAGLALPFRQVDGWMDLPGDSLYYASRALLAAAVAMTVWSGYECYRDAWRQRSGRRSPAQGRPSRLRHPTRPPTAPGSSGCRPAARRRRRGGPGEGHG